MLVTEYMADLVERKLSPSSIHLILTAIRKLAREAADNQLLEESVASAISRVRGPKILGQRTGNWLALEQAKELIQAADSSRDRAILALLISCGLRRTELISLRIDQFVEREGRKVIIDLKGKGGRLRTVPVPAESWRILSLYLSATADLRDRLFPLSTNAIWKIFTKYSKKIGCPASPHDARRTCAALCEDAGAPIRDIQELLGHSSVQVTERYLRQRHAIRNAANDRIVWEACPKT